MIDWPEPIGTLLGAVGPLAARELAPHAARWDADGAFDADLAGRLGEMGLFGVSVPEAQGGAGAGMLGATAVIEELASYSGALAVRLAVHEAVGVGLALLSGDAGLLARVLAPSVFVGWLGPDRGVVARPIGARVHLRGDARMVPGDADLVIAASSADGPVVGFAAAEQLGARRPRRASGLRALGWSDVGVDVELARVDGGGVPERLAARLSVLVGACACGLARAAITQAIAYAKVREQFGEPIARFQAIQWKFANSATERDAAWLLVCKAAARLDAGAADADDAAARAQLAAVRAAVAACSEALQVHGGYGYTREFAIERLLRDARACTAIDRGDDDLRGALVPGIARRFA